MIFTTYVYSNLNVIGVIKINLNTALPYCKNRQVYKWRFLGKGNVLIQKGSMFRKPKY